jgi:hypothetical protein
MQLHDYPESEWQPYLNLVDSDMELLAYCQELDPVASRLRDTLSQYMQFLRMPSLAPKRKPLPAWARAAVSVKSTSTSNSPSQPQSPAQNTQDIVDLLLTIPSHRAGPAHTSTDLRKLVCQPFNDESGSKAMPYVLENSEQAAPRDKWEYPATGTWMPLGWQQCQSSAAYIGGSTNLALTMAQQREMLRAGV